MEKVREKPQAVSNERANWLELSISTDGNFEL
jgi:hypothetical protein